METTLKIGDTVEAEVTRITSFGAFAKIGQRGLGLIHISQISDDFVKDINKHLKLGDRVKAKVVKIGPGKKIDLSLKNSASRIQNNKRRETGFKPSDFKEKLENFLQRPLRQKSS